MKKNDLILIAITGLYSFLFYGELPGINLSLFTIILIVSMIIKNKEILKNWSWILIALSCLITSFSVSYLGNTLSLITSSISLFILVGTSMDSKSSILFSTLYGIYSLISSPLFLFLDVHNKKRESVDISKYKRLTILISIPLLITTIFFFMYKNSNPIFSSFADKINFRWISWGWITFTLAGFAFLYGFLNSRKINELAVIDEVESLTINAENKKELIIFGKTILVMDEYFSGKLLFILLNILIAVVNLLDFNFIFINRALPNNLTYSQLIHQGVGMLVVSIIISISIILFYFRGQLNFYKENKMLKLLAYFWILQNIFMLISVCLKNSMYVEYYGLTYKRIGIYIYVTLTLIGLFTTMIKIYKVKLNLFLVRVNGWTFYSVLLVCCLINWDGLIIDYNQKCKSKYDLYYVLSLANANIPSMIEIEKGLSVDYDKIIFSKILDKKMRRFKKNHSKVSWKSWNYQDEKVSKAIEKYEKDKLTACH